LADALNEDWTTFSPSQEQIECLQAILGTEEGVLAQQLQMQRQMDEGRTLAQSLGVTQAEAKLACAALYCLGGAAAVRRAVRLGDDLSSRSICATMDSMGYAGSVILDALN
jgi:hypothetical protein